MASARPTLFYNATIHTVEDRTPKAEWFTTLGSRFQSVGSGPMPRVSNTVDLKGRVVVPGFVDAHAHFFQTGLDRLFISMAGVASAAEVIERLRTASGKTSWIFAHSYQEESLHDVKALDRSHLDPAFPDRPVWITRVDYHSAVVNSYALRRLSIPAGLDGYRTDENGEPTGVLRAEAYLYAKERVARLYPVESKNRAVRAASELCVANGITAIHALEGGRIFGDEGAGTLLARVHTVPLDVTLFLQQMNVHFTTRLGFDHLGGCILVDGSIGSYTAALDEPYEGLPAERGLLYLKSRDLNGFVEDAHRAGIQLAFHAIGPRAITMVLDAYDRALKRYPRYDHRHRIEHFELATDAQIHRARDLGCIVSMQPAFEYFWGGPKKMYAKRIGDRWKRTNRLRSVLDAGLIIAGGSDTNVTPPNPLLGMHAAVNHPNPEQRVTPMEALTMMTRAAAYGAFNENRHGSITPGKEASFTVLDRDPLRSARSIKDIHVLQTWCKGKRVYRAHD